MRLLSAWLTRTRQPWRWLVLVGRGYAWVLIALLALIAVSITVDLLKALLGLPV